jgi:glycosyltransferase involved in cell wall biosynthesis
MSRKLVVLTEIIAPYRIPVFNALAGEDGIDLHVIFLSETDAALRQWNVYKEEIRFSYQVLPSWRWRSKRLSLLLNWGLGTALEQAQPDAILCGGYNYLSSWRAAWWARRKRVPLIVWVESTARDFRSRRPTVESLKRKFLQSCHAFVVAGKSSSDYLTDYHVPRQLIFRAPNAIDSDFFSRRAGEIRLEAHAHRTRLVLPQRYFLFVGRLIPEKGVFDLLTAYGALPPELRAEISLVFVGIGSAQQELVARAKFMSPGSVKFTGFAQRDDLASYYALAESFVFPTLSDPWGLVVNEAMVCGLPIIVSDAAGCAADMVEDGWNGCVFPAGNTQRLTRALEEMALRGAKVGEMSERSLQRVRQYSPRHCAAGIAQAALSLPVRGVA